MSIFAIYFIPIFVWVVYQYMQNREFVLWEAAAQLFGTLIVFSMVIALSYMSAYSDSGIIVGRVQEKKVVTYQCNMYWSDYTSYGCENYYTRQVKTGRSCSGSGKHRSCHDTYKTQYRYIYPWEKDYVVNANVGSSTIDRIDRQGAQTPPRWIEAYVNEPYAAVYSFKNYVKAAKHSIFNRDEKIIEGLSYPQVVDYYRVDDRLSKTTGISWKALMEQSAVAGTNILVYKGDATAESLAKTLAGHKIYDMVIAMDNDGKPEIRSWSKTDIVNIQVRDHVADNPDNWIDGLGEIVKQYYVKPEEKDFEYLAHEAEFPIWGHIILIIMLIASVFGITYLFSNNDQRKH